MPFQRNPLFTGREEVLERLHQMLSAGKTTALAQPRAISGLGGIGKTQTAVEYAYRYQNDYRYIFWIKAESRETLLTDFSTLAQLLHLSDKQEQDANRTIEGVKHWFGEHTDWLLIFDNADDLSILRGFLPTAGKDTLY